MEGKKRIDNNFFYESIVKKTKTGITLPKELRDELFGSDEEVFFKLIVPNEKDKIILKILSKEESEKVTAYFA